MLNIAGPDYDFARVLFVVLQDWEHRRRSFDDAELEQGLQAAALDKLAHIKAAYEEVGGSPAYWHALEREVIETALPQYVDEAGQMNALERSGFNVFRKGDVAARFMFALAGLLIGSIIIALPFIPIFEDLFAFGLTATGFLYPDIVRYTYERRHFRVLNRLVTEAAACQQSERLAYMTSKELDEAIEPEALPRAKAEEQRQLPPKGTIAQ